MSLIPGLVFIGPYLSFFSPFITGYSVVVTSPLPHPQIQPKLLLKAPVGLIVAKGEFIRKYQVISKAHSRFPARPTEHIAKEEERMCKQMLSAKSTVVIAAFCLRGIVRNLSEN